MAKMKMALPTLAIASLWGMASANFGFELDGTLDKPAISQAYFEGEFHRIIPPLEMYRQSFPTTATRNDSIFVFKYLGVVYAADSTTRVKAESYMRQLIHLMPTIEILDLYISPRIQSIFDKVKQDYLKDQSSVQQNDSHGSRMADSLADFQRTRHWITAIVGGVGAAAVVAATLYVLGEESEAKTNRVVLSVGKGQQGEK